MRILRGLLFMRLMPDNRSSIFDSKGEKIIVIINSKKDSIRIILLDRSAIRIKCFPLWDVIPRNSILSESFRVSSPLPVDLLEILYS